MLNDEPSERNSNLLPVNATGDVRFLSVASAGNDHRLGGNEAPPAIISMFLGDEITDLLETISSGKEYSNRKGNKLSTGVESVPEIYEDTTDRNRTSPVAFTGNKFEFRSLGSSFNIACTNVMINAAVADTLNSYADKLEKVDKKDFKKVVLELIKAEYIAHKRIVFNGDNYADEWQTESARRGLLNLKGTPEALSYYDREENVELFKRLKIYTPEEVRARKEILLENYCKVINIEALTMLEMVRRDILPAVSDYVANLCANVAAKQAVCEELPCTREKETIMTLAKLNEEVGGLAVKLENELAEIDLQDVSASSQAMAHNVVPLMEEIRERVDKMETLTASDYWPYPTYFDLLYSVN